jgi:hypothetical protein
MWMGAIAGSGPHDSGNDDLNSPAGVGHVLEIPPGVGTCELGGGSGWGCTGWRTKTLVPNTARRIRLAG